jgi:thioredoxin-like negative regulator of GroEL
MYCPVRSLTRVLCLRFDLAQALVSAGDPAGAVEHLLEIVKIDKTWNAGAGREMLLKVRQQYV